MSAPGEAGSDRLERLFFGVLGVVIILATWEALNRFGIVSSVMLSSPSQVVSAAIVEWRAGSLRSHTWATVYVWLAGFGLATLVGVPLGLSIGFYKRWSYVADPALNVLFAVPSLALVPVVIVWVGIGFNFKITMVFIATVFYIAVNATAGAKASELRLLDVAEVYGASRARVFTTVVLPGSFPYILTGCRQGASRALVAIVIAEFIASNEGLGFMITFAGTSLNTARLMLGLAILSVLGIAAGEGIGLLEKRFAPWRL